jgi:hypothetical protein
MHTEALKFREVMAQMMAAHSSPRTTKSSSPPCRGAAGASPRGWTCSRNSRYRLGDRAHPAESGADWVTANAVFDVLDQAIAGLLEVDVSASGTVTADPAAALKCKMLRANARRQLRRDGQDTAGGGADIVGGHEKRVVFSATFRS